MSEPPDSVSHMTTNLPNNIKNILEYLAAMAAGYHSGLKWNEEEKLKSDLNKNRLHWLNVSTSDVHDYCIDLGMSPKDARRIADLLNESQGGKRFRPRSYGDHQFNHEALAAKQPTGPSRPDGTDTPAAITVNGASFPEAAQEQAVRWATKQRQAGGGSILAFAPQLRNVTDNTGRIARLVDAKQVKLSTPRTREHLGHRGPIIALWPTSEMLDELHGTDNPVCVVPWNGKDVEPWVRATSPEVLGDDWRTPPGASNPTSAPYSF